MRRINMEVLRNNILSSRLAREVRCLRLGSPTSILIGIHRGPFKIFQTKIRLNKYEYKYIYIYISQLCDR
jgi:hypothetical protein